MTLKELGDRVASGRTADIYRWGDGQILKLFQPWVGLRSVEGERRKSAGAAAAGLPVPVVGEIIHIGERVGLIFERLIGISMMDQIVHGQIEIEASAIQLADLHLSLHRAAGPLEFPRQPDLLRAKIQEAPLLSPPERAAALAALDQMPRGDNLCHGDFHPGNIMVTARGPVIIDWMDASRGDPCSDLARTMLLFLGHLETSPVSDGNRDTMRRYHDAYLGRYEGAVPGARIRYQRWLPVLAAARLSERIEEQNPWLLSLARNGCSPDVPGGMSGSPSSPE